jgi:hypothetical protein
MDEPELVESTDGWDLFRVEVDGQSAAFMLPAIQDEWPTELKNAVSLRRESALSGRCKCGATRRIDAVQDQVVLEHQSWCRAGDQRLAAIAKRNGFRLG